MSQTLQVVQATQHVVAHSQQIAPQASQAISQAPVLPLWIEYVKALGAPFVAVVAAVIASAISYQQWRTARNKLKLDLFEKRLKVYEGCNEIISEIHLPIPFAVKRLEDFTSTVSSAPWLFDDKVAKYVDSLLIRAAQALAKPRLDYGGMNFEQIMEAQRQHLEKTELPVREDIAKLQKHFSPYLKLEH